MDVTPEYLPRLESLLPILRVDSAVWRADKPFSRQGWQNRTRLRNPDGWQWISVPVEHGQFGASISETVIAYHDGWRKRHLKAFKYNYSSSPFYEHYADELAEVFASRPQTLDELNRACLDLVLGWLKHEVGWVTVSVGPDSAEVGAHAGPSRSAEFEHPVYRQNYDGFIPDMSCLDILFTNGPAAIHQLVVS